LLLFSSDAFSQTLNSASELKETQSQDSKTVKNLSSNTSIKILKREGFWVQVEVAGTKGWVKLSSVNMAGQTPSITPLDTGRTGKGNVVSTSAARGLSAKDLTLAKPDSSQFEELKKLSVDSSEADKFAKSGGLSIRQIALVSSGTKSYERNKPKPTSSTGNKLKKPDDDDDED
jgi:hypothetical protein